MHPCRLCSSKGHPACLPSPPRYSRQLPELEQVLLHVLATPGRAWAWPLHGGAAPACRLSAPGCWTAPPLPPRAAAGGGSPTLETKPPPPGDRREWAEDEGRAAR